MMYNRAALEADLQKLDALDSEIARLLVDHAISGFAAKAEYDEVEKLRKRCRFRLVRSGLIVGEIQAGKKAVAQAQANFDARQSPLAGDALAFAKRSLGVAFAAARANSIGDAPPPTEEDEGHLCTPEEREWFRKRIHGR